jgi:hypothetical protein
VKSTNTITQDQHRGKTERHMKAFPIMWRAIRATYDELLLLVGLSVLWWLGTVLVVTAAPATAGLHLVANRMANYKRVDAGFFWEGARRQVKRSWLLYAGNVVLLLAVFVNINFYVNGTVAWMQIVGVMWIWILLFLLLGGQYLFPLLCQQDDPSVKLVARNAILLALRHPLYSFLLFLFQLLIIAISVVLAFPIFLLTPGFVAVAANVGLVGLLQELDLAPPPPPELN